MNPRLQKIEALRQKLQQLEAQQQQIDAREKVESAKRLKLEDTKRKILLGAFTLQQIEKSRCDFHRFELAGVNFESWLTRENDRALFGMPQKFEAPQI